MKKVIFFLIVALVTLAGCNKDEIVDDTADLKSANVPIPMKAWFCHTPDLSIPPVLVTGTPLPGKIPPIYLPGGGNISGNATHMGNVRPEESTMTTLSAYIDFPHLQSTGELVIVALYKGKITAANGDYYLFDSELRIKALNMAYTGWVYMHSGFGKFKNMTGNVTCEGQENCWTGIGTMVYN